LKVSALTRRDLNKPVYNVLVDSFLIFNPQIIDIIEIKTSATNQGSSKILVYTNDKHGLNVTLLEWLPQEGVIIVVSEPIPLILFNQLSPIVALKLKAAKTYWQINISNLIETILLLMPLPEKIDPI
jgi:hypothetical protein